MLTRVEKFCPSLSLRHESFKVFSEYLSVCFAMTKRLALYVTGGNELDYVTDCKLSVVFEMLQRLGQWGYSCLSSYGGTSQSTMLLLVWLFASGS